MAGNRKVNYKNGLDICTKIYFPNEKVDKRGLELISNILNDINSMLISHIETEYRSIDRVNGQTFQQFGRKAIDDNFPEDLKHGALSEAYKQLSLLESGCFFLNYEVATEIKDKTKTTRRSTQEEIEFKRNGVPIRLFKRATIKLLSIIVPKYKVDSEITGVLASSIHAFSKMVAEKASEKVGQKEELQPLDLKHVLEEYLENNLLRVAFSEGNKALALYENGLLEFKPKKTCKSGWSDFNVVSETIFSTDFKTGFKTLLHEIDPTCETDSKAQRYLGQILMDLALFLAENTSETCRKEKILEMKFENVYQSVSEAFPQQLKEHALLKGSNDVMEFRSGMSSFELTPLTHKKSSKKIGKSKKLTQHFAVRPQKQAEVRKTSPKTTRRLSVQKLTSKSRRKRTKKSMSKAGQQSPKKSSHIHKRKSLKKTTSKSRPRSPKRSKLKFQRRRTKSHRTHTQGISQGTPSKSRPRCPKRSKPTSQRRRTKSPPTHKQGIEGIRNITTELVNFSVDVMSNMPDAISRVNLSLPKETASQISQLLENVCEALIYISVHQAKNSKELGAEDITAALRKLFPRKLAEHALSVASNALFLYFEEM